MSKVRRVGRSGVDEDMSIQNSVQPYEVIKLPEGVRGTVSQTEDGKWVAAVQGMPIGAAPAGEPTSDPDEFQSQTEALKALQAVLKTYGSGPQG